MCSGTRGFPCGLLYRNAGPKAVPTMFERSVGDVGPTFFFCWMNISFPIIHFTRQVSSSNIATFIQILRMLADNFVKFSRGS